MQRIIMRATFRRVSAFRRRAINGVLGRGLKAFMRAVESFFLGSSFLLQATCNLVKLLC